MYGLPKNGLFISKIIRMKSILRIYRRPSTSVPDVASLVKDYQKEAACLSKSSKETFFKPRVIASPAQSIQRKCAACEQPEKQVQRLDERQEQEKKLQRVADKQDDEKLHRKSDMQEEEKLQKKETTVPNTGIVNNPAFFRSLNGKGEHLPKQTNEFFSARMGYNFRGVKVHTDQEAAQTAKELNAKAYTIGNHIVFNEGQFNTESSEGKKLLAHELTHVAQNDDRKLFRQPSDDMENCKGWRSDPHSITVAAANKIMKEELKWDKVTIQKITKCDIWDPDNKRWGCDFFTNDKRKGSCLILPKQNRLNIRIGRKDGKDGSFYCFYNFTCDTKSGKITLIKAECGGATD